MTMNVISVKSLLLCLYFLTFGASALSQCTINNSGTDDLPVGLGLLLNTNTAGLPVWRDVPTFLVYAPGANDCLSFCTSSNAIGTGTQNYVGRTRPMTVQLYKTLNVPVQVTGVTVVNPSGATLTVSPSTFTDLPFNSNAHMNIIFICSPTNVLSVVAQLTINFSANGKQYVRSLCIPRICAGAVPVGVDTPSAMIVQGNVCFNSTYCSVPAAIASQAPLPGHDGGTLFPGVPSHFEITPSVGYTNSISGVVSLGSVSSLTPGVIQASPNCMYNNVYATVSLTAGSATIGPPEVVFTPSQLCTWWCSTAVLSVAADEVIVFRWDFNVSSSAFESLPFSWYTAGRCNNRQTFLTQMELRQFFVEGNIYTKTLDMSCNEFNDLGKRLVEQLATTLKNLNANIWLSTSWVLMDIRSSENSVNLLTKTPPCRYTRRSASAAPLASVNSSLVFFIGTPSTSNKGLTVTDVDYDIDLFLLQSQEGMASLTTSWKAILNPYVTPSGGAISVYSISSSQAVDSGATNSVRYLISVGTVIAVGISGLMIVAVIIAILQRRSRVRRIQLQLHPYRSSMINSTGESDDADNTKCHAQFENVLFDDVVAGPGMDEVRGPRIDYNTGNMIETLHMDWCKRDES